LQIADEMAVSETAFLTLDDMRLRWFSPKVEVKLCGHGTLAAAHIMKTLGLLQNDETLTFNTLSGPLVVKALKDQIEMDFPAAEIDFTTEPSDEMLDCLGLSAEQVVASGSFEGNKLLIEIESETELRALSPNFDSLKKLPGRSVVVTAKPSVSEVNMSESQQQDFISRNFAPWVGVNEDPVTGSAHCALAVYWGNILNKSRLTGYQASARGGFVGVELLAQQRVKLIGHAVTTIKGTLSL